MRIRQIDVYTVVLRYLEPLRLSHAICYDSENVIVRIRDEDHYVGVGEASPSQATNESTKTILFAIDKIAGHMKSSEDTEINQIIEENDDLLLGNPSAKSAIDIALHDIFGQRMGKPLFELFGKFRKIQTDLTLSSGTPKQMAQDASDAVARGFKALKIKVAISPRDDVERIKAVRNSVGSDIALRIDANQGWKTNQAIDMLAKLEAFNIEFVEQPVKANDYKGLRKVRRSCSIPVMADESVCSPSDAKKIIGNEAADLINIKLMKCGGILRAKEIAKIAQEAKIPCMCGCMGESNIGITAAVHLTSALEIFKFADLDSDVLLRDNLVLEGGAEMKGSERIPPTKPGLGILKLDERSLSKPVRTYAI